MPSVTATSFGRKLPRPPLVQTHTQNPLRAPPYIQHLLLPAFSTPLICIDFAKLFTIAHISVYLCAVFAFAKLLRVLRLPPLPSSSSVFLPVHWGAVSPMCPNTEVASLPDIDMGSGDDTLSLIKEDMVWSQIKRDALDMRSEECEFLLDMGASELLMGILQSSVFQWHSFEEALASLLASKLSSDAAPKHRWHTILLTAFTEGSSLSGVPIRSLIKQDLMAIKDRDPACPSLGHAFLYFKGYHGIQVHRVANWLWHKGQRSLASLFQSRVSEVFGMDIHPAAQLGSCIMIDHATGIVIGETARVGNGCTLLHGVTLGGNGKQQGDRHPKLGVNVLVGAGASILGNILIGDGAKIGASAVVLSDIPPFSTAVGCPAKVIGRAKEKNPASVLDHSCRLVDHFCQRLKGTSQNLHFSKADVHEFVDQLQNVCGLEVPEEEAMALFFERKRSTSRRLHKQPSDINPRLLQYSTPTCVCLT